MNLTLSKLNIKPIFLAILCLTCILKVSAQEINENYIFYSPSDQQMGHLTFINEELHLFTNNETILLMSSDGNTHLDTLNLQSTGIQGMLQYLMVIDENTFAVGSFDNYALINIKSNKLKVSWEASRKDFRKKGIKENMYVLLPDGIFTYDMKKKRKEFTYSLSYYNTDYKLVHKNYIKLDDINKNDLSNWAIIYPHQISFQNGLISLSLKNLASHIRFNIKNGKINQINLKSFIENDEAAEIFYDPVKDENYLVNYASAEKGKARVFIYKMDKKNNAKYKLNDGVIELKKIRGGIYNNKIMLMDDFKGSLAFYLVPIDEIHKL
ncbi:hypothetical protein [Marivirga sp.]|uniref:hypothetical protein n=1 Tax=Marivirga sp. TaxID=2018662 RepID=UPI002D801846|nr:hypothetical protein [Marivirga sp.]HET8861071.1 hypothetical protein [Marivirga sp.]